MPLYEGTGYGYDGRDGAGGGGAAGGNGGGGQQLWDAAAAQSAQAAEDHAVQTLLAGSTSFHTTICLRASTRNSYILPFHHQ